MCSGTAGLSNQAISAPPQGQGWDCDATEGLQCGGAAGVSSSRLPSGGAVRSPAHGARGRAVLRCPSERSPAAWGGASAATAIPGHGHESPQADRLRRGGGRLLCPERPQIGVDRHHEHSSGSHAGGVTRGDRSGADRIPTPRWRPRQRRHRPGRARRVPVADEAG